MPFSEGYTMAYHLNLDGLGTFYICLAVAWTLALIPAAIFLIRNRKLPYLRMRNIPLALAGVATLHVYWCLCYIAYVLNGYFPCATEYWIMSIYLPLGIALFNVSNTQLFYIAGLQKKYADPEKRIQPKQKVAMKKSWRGLLQQVRTYRPTQRTLTFIGIGMVVQFLCSMTVFLLSRKFHPSFGVTGREVNMAACRRGWEWWPSIFWQFGWAWVYAPSLLWKVRGIRDVHGWRLQTVCCALSGMPGSPLWLSALYIKAFAPVNKYWVPPMWFSPSIMLMQFFMIFWPCMVVWKNRRLEAETRQIIAEWEARKKWGGSLSSDSTKVASKSKFSLQSSTTSTARSCNGEMYTMSTLEKTLHLNPKPLLLFAALRDFSGENVSFLTHLNDWKKNWAPISPIKTSFLRKDETDKRTEKAVRREQYNLAVHIYSAFASMQYSEFPINISHVHQRELEIMFALAAAKMNSKAAKNAATPFDEWSGTEDVESSLIKDQASVTIIGVNSTDDFMSSPEKKHYSQVQSFKLSDIKSTLPDDIEVPSSFGAGAFDNAEKSIKELVLTNTWPKFVNAGYADNMEKANLKEKVNIFVDNAAHMWTKMARKRAISSPC